MEEVIEGGENEANDRDENKMNIAGKPSQEDGFRPGYENRRKDKARQGNQDKRNERKDKFVTRKEQSQERDPTLLRFPVIIEETVGRGKLSKMSPHTVTTALNTQSRSPISRYKILNSGKLVVECTGPRQQTALSHCTHLAEVEVKCRIPSPTVEGVIRCLGFDDEEWALIQKQSRRQNEIAYIQRLKNKHGHLTSAAKVVFNRENLPQEVIIGSQIFDVEPYRPPIRRCNKCQKLGHTRKFCVGKDELCSRCGRAGHGARLCKDVPRCVNCCGQHYSSAMDCPAALVWQRATHNRAKNYVPFSVAFRNARREIAEENKLEKEKGTEQTPLDVPTVKISYAAAARNTKNTIRDHDTQQQKQKQTNLPGSNTKLLAVQMDEDIIQLDLPEVKKPKRKRPQPQQPPRDMREINEVIVENEITNMRRELEGTGPIAGGTISENPDALSVWDMPPAPRHPDHHNETDTLQSAQRIAEMIGPMQNGTRILFAMGHYRKDGDVNKLLTEIFAPEPPPRRTILLECLLVAAGIIDERSPDSDNLPVF